MVDAEGLSTKLRRVLRTAIRSLVKAEIDMKELRGAGRKEDHGRNFDTVILPDTNTTERLNQQQNSYRK